MLESVAQLFSMTRKDPLEKQFNLLEGYLKTFEETETHPSMVLCRDLTLAAIKTEIARIKRALAEKSHENMQ